ncbi:class I SAM-dependent methyltransferase [Thalassotalea mangrovi]|uniref:Class I SAM-dependent methyltransferase n=1 Tax=Thalassotalea mangrovi TaxID=2572245 RepID=A0A4U1B457_9GAMM|nr:class I SAM-dependent methyltransferase [Thalassotalea mangrovi]TKB44910.1 class I SAM-dependent methyltransferase [Thalassotalea mangrovi]
MDKQQHWQQVFVDKNAKQMSWSQDCQDTSYRQLNALQLPNSATILEAGCGISDFSIEALTAGYGNLALLDISQQALAIQQQKHIDKKLDSSNCQYICQDLGEQNQPLMTKIENRIDCWIDRAVFHFLIDEKQRQQYFNYLLCALKSQGYWLLATFSERGPDKCSNLPVQRYSHIQLTDYLQTIAKDEFTCRQQWQQTHVTPWGAEQHFNWWLLQRR